MTAWSLCWKRTVQHAVSTNTVAHICGPTKEYPLPQGRIYAYTCWEGVKLQDNKKCVAFARKGKGWRQGGGLGRKELALLPGVLGLLADSVGVWGKKGVVVPIPPLASSHPKNLNSRY